MRGGDNCAGGKLKELSACNEHGAPPHELIIVIASYPKPQHASLSAARPRGCQVVRGEAGEIPSIRSRREKLGNLLVAGMKHELRDPPFQELLIQFLLPVFQHSLQGEDI